MNIQKFKQISEAELLSRLKKTRLKGFGQPEVYKNATLEILEHVDPERLVPAQRYVLSDGVRCIIDLADAFAAYGIDAFALRGGIFFWPDGMDPESEPPIPLLPPVVEESNEPDGRTVLLIND